MGEFWAGFGTAVAVVFVLVFVFGPRLAYWIGNRERKYWAGWMLYTHKTYGTEALIKELEFWHREDM